ncbi:hypothetical protein B0H10DRAFT_2344427 [Mycena sp. CBHHK59/15]|nr:hypothetical protein B0H10DRAFT_2344427 [Mycena sp. CBHHK59/15]
MPMNINPNTGRFHFSHYSQTHRQYSPYTPSHPSAVPIHQRENELWAHDPSPTVLQLCRDEIAAARQASVCGCHGRQQVERLVQFARPIEQCKQGLLRLLAASRFQFTPGIMLPRCPHAANGFRTIEETTQVCKRVLLTAEELTDYLNTPDYIDGDAEDTDNEDFYLEAVVGTSEWCTPPQGSSEERVGTYLNNSSRMSSLNSIEGSMSSPSTLPSSSFLSDSSSSSPVRPSPRPKGTSVRPYFSPMVSAKRKSPNYVLIATVSELDDNGFYKCMYPSLLV